MTEDERAGRHDWLNGLESAQAHWEGEGQGSPACRGPWGCNELDTTE